MKFFLSSLLFIIFVCGPANSGEAQTLLAYLTSGTDDSGSSREETNSDNLYAVLCFKKGEQISGMNKICYYDCLGSMTAINVKSYQLCPLTIKN